MWSGNALLSFKHSLVFTTHMGFVMASVKHPDKMITELKTMYTEFEFIVKKLY